MGDFTKLAVWKKAHDLALRVYHETSHWPKHELFGLTSQSRRAAVWPIAQTKRARQRRARFVDGGAGNRTPVRD